MVNKKEIKEFLEKQNEKTRIRELQKKHEIEYKEHLRKLKIRGL